MYDLTLVQYVTQIVCFIFRKW